ncbi:MAG: ribulose-phosphate 3-epimerase [Deltaproteobacteria bacterium]|nr:ribulose-phosphate 3-epimerase [Deltaproteobacteria bacterium]
MTIIAPSLLSADPGRFREEIQAMEAAGADWLHIDVMDGHFAPNLTFGPWMLEMAKKATSLPLDAHLMTSDPLKYGPVFAKAGADYVTVHIEATPHLDRCLNAIAEAGAKPGVALNPATAVSLLDSCLSLPQLFLIMGVNPGFSGQPYIPSTADKARRLRALLESRDLSPLVSVDGGVNYKNAFSLTSAGADVLVSGSVLFQEKDYKAAIGRLRAEASGIV